MTTAEYTAAAIQERQLYYRMWRVFKGKDPEAIEKAFAGWFGVWKVLRETEAAFE